MPEPRNNRAKLEAAYETARAELEAASKLRKDKSSDAPSESEFRVLQKAVDETARALRRAQNPRRTRQVLNLQQEIREKAMLRELEAEAEGDAA